MATKKSSLLQSLSKFVSGQTTELWQGTLEDYIEIVSKDPSIHMTAHTRVLKMIESHGFEKIPLEK